MLLFWVFANLVFAGLNVWAIAVWGELINWIALVMNLGAAFYIWTVWEGERVRW